MTSRNPFRALWRRIDPRPTRRQRRRSRGSDDAIADAAQGILAVENAPLPLVVALPDGQVAMANRALRDLLGYGPTDLVGLQLLDLLVDRLGAASCWDELMTTGQTPDRPVELRHRSGTPIAVRSASRVVYDDAGATRYVIGRALLA